MLHQRLPFGQLGSIGYGRNFTAQSHLIYARAVIGSSQLRAISIMFPERHRLKAGITSSDWSKRSRFRITNIDMADITGRGRFRAWGIVLTCLATPKHR
ncbi:hypothetical protein DXT91_24305 [Agrobacterium tumefaciens]|nr:hypothetical protein [Agrobacterium tumefaciens]